MSNNKTKNHQGQIHVYTGNSKGKTTSALGLAIRAIGHGFKVGIIYFDKGGDYYSERKILDQLKNNNLHYRAFGLPRMTKNKGFRFANEPGDLSQAQAALDMAMAWMSEGFDLLILDEINTTVKTGLLKLPDIVKLIQQKPKKLELVLTGRYCPSEIIDLADLVTDMKSIKHYISKGMAARPGIEY